MPRKKPRCIAPFAESRLESRKSEMSGYERNEIKKASLMHKDTHTHKHGLYNARPSLVNTFILPGATSALIGGHRKSQEILFGHCWRPSRCHLSGLRRVFRKRRRSLGKGLLIRTPGLGRPALPSWSVCSRERCEPEAAALPFSGGCWARRLPCPLSSPTWSGHCVLIIG